MFKRASFDLLQLFSFALGDRKEAFELSCENLRDPAMLEMLILEGRGGTLSHFQERQRLNQLGQKLGDLFYDIAAQKNGMFAFLPFEQSEDGAGEALIVDRYRDGFDQWNKIFKLRPLCKPVCAENAAPVLEYKNSDAMIEFAVREESRYGQHAEYLFSASIYRPGQSSASRHGGNALRCKGALAVSVNSSSTKLMIESPALDLIQGAPPQAATVHMSHLTMMELVVGRMVELKRGLREPVTQ